MYDKLITVKVGPNKEPFEVHCALLYHYSTYFKATLNGDSKGFHHGSVALDEDDPGVFRIFFNWLYTQRLADSAVMNSAIAKHRLYPKVWVFGDARGIPQLQNAVMDEYMAFHITMGGCVSRDEMLWILEHAPNTPLLRRFAFDLLVGRPRGSVITQLKSWQRVESHQLAKEFFSGVACALAARLPPSPHGATGEWRGFDNTKYHVPLIAEAKE